MSEEMVIALLTVFMVVTYSIKYYIRRVILNPNSKRNRPVAVAKAA